MSMRQELPTDKRYSLYLVPDEPVQSELQKLVSQLAGEFSAPVFVPHLTLLPEQWGQEAEILALVTSLAREVSTPITLQMLTVVARNSYFQCVLATTSLPEELAQLATGARQLFGVADENIPFHPHISLLYDGQDSTKTILDPEKPLVLLAPIWTDSTQASEVSKALADRVGHTRDHGSSSWQSYLVLTGKSEAALHFRLSIWDIGAAIPLAQELGLSVVFSQANQLEKLLQSFQSPVTVAIGHGDLPQELISAVEPWAA